MAKVSKVNVSITGDSKGLTKASDKAQADLRRLRVEQEKLKRSMAAGRSTIMQTAESMGKLGIASRSLGALGGGLGLISLGPAGLGLAAIGAVTAGLSTVVQALQTLPDERAKAVAALDQLDLAGARSLAELGFTRRGAEALAALPAPTAGMGISSIQALARGMAVAGAGAGPLATAAQAGPQTVAAFAGGLLGGQTSTQAMGTAGNVVGFDTLMRLMGADTTNNAAAAAMAGMLEMYWSK